jgi:hypothetical protein
MKLPKIKLAFRNMDGPTEMMESGFARLYSRILVANSGKRQRGYSHGLRQTGPEHLSRDLTGK